MNAKISIPWCISVKEANAQSQFITSQLPFGYCSNSYIEFVSTLNENTCIVFCGQPLSSYLSVVDRDIYNRKSESATTHSQHVAIMPGILASLEFCNSFIASHNILPFEPNSTAENSSFHSTPFDENSDESTNFSMSNSENGKNRKLMENLFFHDIMNTVCGLMGYSELLQDASSVDIKKYSPIISNLVSNLSDQIISQREIIDASEHQKLVSTSIIHAKSFLGSVVQSLEQHKVAKNKTILIDSSAEDFLFISDEDILRRVIGNLTKNALEATKDNSIVHLSCQRKHSEVFFSVINNEVIPRDYQRKIFCQTFSTKEDGRGMGTQSVKLFTEQYLKGKASFISNENDGTIFTVMLPITLRTSKNTHHNITTVVEEVFV